MAEDFGISVRIAPEAAANAQAVTKIAGDLEGLERKGKSTGAAIGKALGGGVDSAARDAARAAADLRGQFDRLHASVSPVVRAEQDYAAAVKTANAAVAAGIATEKQAVDIITEKRRALDDVRAKTDEARAAGDKHNVTIAESIRQTIKSNSGFMNAIDIVGKLGMAMGTVNQAFTVGRTLVSTYHVAMSALSSVFKGGDDRMQWEKTDPNNLLNTAARVAEQQRRSNSSFWSGVATTTMGADVDSDANRERRRQAREDAKLRDEMARASDRAKAEFELAKRQAEQERSLALARENASRGGGGGRRVSAVEAEGLADPTHWDELAGYISAADGYLYQFLDHANDFAETVPPVEESASLWDEIRGNISAADGYLGQGIDAMVKFAAKQEEATKHAKEYADALAGPLKNALDGLAAGGMEALINGMDDLNFSFRDWGRAALAEIAAVTARMLALRAITSIFGAGGGSGGAGQFLFGLLGGTSSRTSSGDPFGSSGGGSAPIITERVAPAGRGAGGGYGAPAVNVKVVTVSNAHEAAREVMNSADGERAILAAYQKNAGKLRAAAR